MQVPEIGKTVEDREIINLFSLDDTEVPEKENPHASCCCPSSRTGRACPELCPRWRPAPLSWLRERPNSVFCALRTRLGTWELSAGKLQSDTLTVDMYGGLLLPLFGLVAGTANRPQRLRAKPVDQMPCQRCRSTRHLSPPKATVSTNPRATGSYSLAS